MCSEGVLIPFEPKNTSWQVWRVRAPLHSDTPQQECTFTRAEKFAIDQAENLIRIINDSTRIASNSKVFKTRQSRIVIARQRLGDLLQIVEVNNFMGLTKLAEVEQDIASLEAKIIAEGVQAGGYPNSDIISGLEFCATMQLRTPLRVLLRHGELFSDLPNDPPQIARAMWEGIWTTYGPSFRELGIELDEPPPGQLASSIGPVPIDGGDYLKFLIAVREIVESANSVNGRMALVISEASRPKWYMFKHARFHSAYDIADYFFPLFVSTIPRLTRRAAEELRKLGLDTPDTLVGATDAQLLQVPGIGPRTLAEIRKKCAETTIDRDNVRVDQVER